MGARSRRKGAVAEREVAELLRPLFPGARRRCSGEESQDAVPGRDLDGTPGLCVQVQCSARPDPLRKLAEAQAAASGSEIPVAFVRRSSWSRSTGWVACLPADDPGRLVGLAGGATIRRVLEAVESAVRCAAERYAQAEAEAAVVCVQVACDEVRSQYGLR